MKGIPAATVLKKLEKQYKPPRTFLAWNIPLELLIATVLSAQCTDVRVNIVMQTLRKKYRTPQAYLKVSLKELEDDIHSCGTYHNKAKFIRGIASIIIEKHKGKVPDTMEALTALPGVGRKTAAIILYAVFGKNEGIAVDTHVLRLARRLGLTKQKVQHKIEIDLMHAIPRKKWGELTTLLISHGRAVCTAKNRRCNTCIFAKECPSSLTMGRRDLAKT